MSSHKKFDLIAKIQKSSNDDNQSSNFNMMIKKKPYTSLNKREKKVLTKLLSDKILPDINNIIHDYLKPQIVWLYKTDLEKAELYKKYGLFKFGGVLAKISIDNGKLNGLTKIFGTADDRTNRKYFESKKSNHKQTKDETFENKLYKVNSLMYYKDDQLHRIDGPAVEYSDGYTSWYKNGQPHRINGPAMEYFVRNGDKFWYFNGKLHRIDGPAKEYRNGEKRWLQYGKLHREDGPAVEYSNGDKEWYQYGERHRLDGPATKYPGVIEQWLQYGKLHRINGPATEASNGIKRYYLDDVEYSKSRYDEIMSSRSS